MSSKQAMRSFCLWVCLVSILYASQSLANSEMTYRIKLNDKEAGHLIGVYQLNEDGSFSLTQTTELTVSGFLQDTNIQGVLIEHHLQDGTLTYSDNRLIHNDKIFWTKVALSNNEYLAVHSEVTTSEQKQEKKDVEFVTGTVAHFVPAVGYALTLGEILLSDESHAPKNDLFTQDHFDTSFVALPHYWQQAGYTLPPTVAIFDTENMALFSANTKKIGRVELSLKNETIQAQQYLLDIEGEEPINVWLAETDANIPYFVKISGQEDNDSYTIQLEGTKE
ncbi:hypothetical protein [uncultured Vibrio sp.]|uniref:hypothetical protein n=1 Tax=uncultured Vibrio sp. TaxID=114054 RepID=UPI0025F5782E|nr:hypothetical protein [uncultured Vibrio sp.]